ncbi:hypothetical protein [Hymenobacter negativus]|uniref:DUF4136 domain-containing protein n=1 Tax=Hymenobacter negativus TaxID=2795026 RepID=A0ABS3QJA8_9BACT|nr:hypothetical protein [Hymenobacter negativus]MBO2011323.1 hypothetical protein [Hymenobacter negativus]
MHKLLLLGVTLALTSLAPPTYKTYYNQRFGYRIDYPADLRPQPEAGNGDGRRFVSADGQTVLSAYAGYNVLDEGLAADRRIARQSWQKKHATITLDQLTRTGYVLSGQLQGTIFYEKTVLKNNTLTTFLWEYPATRKAAMDAVIQHTVQTLQPSVAGDD